MSDHRTSSQIALDHIERKLVDAKCEARSFKERGKPVPDDVVKKIMNLRGAAAALRRNDERQNR